MYVCMYVCMYVSDGCLPTTLSTMAIILIHMYVCMYVGLDDDEDRRIYLRVTWMPSWN